MLRVVDRKSRSPMNHDATEDCRKAQKILKEHDSGTGQAGITDLRTLLAMLLIMDTENVPH